MAVLSKKDVEDTIAGKGDYVKIDHLTRFLTKSPPLEVKKFIYLELGEVYKDKGMYSEAAKYFGFLGELVLTFREKINFFIKECELHIQAGNFGMADNSFKKIMHVTNEKEIVVAKRHIHDFYIDLARKYEKADRRIQAIKVYEKILELTLSDEGDKKNAKMSLMNLYEKTGRMREYFK